MVRISVAEADRGPDHYWSVIRDSLRSSAMVGPMVHEARIAAICPHNGVTTLLSADRDFSRFSIPERNPLVVRTPA